MPPDTPEHPVFQASVSTPNLELKLYGETKQGVNPGTGIWEIQRASPKDDPTGLAKIRWRTKQTGFHMLRPIVKLADGTWLAGDHAEEPSADWRETEFAFADVRWHWLNIGKVVTTRSSDWVVNPDLNRVDEVGFTDLMPGAVADKGHGTSGASRVD